MTTDDRGLKNPEWFDRFHAPENAAKAQADLAHRLAAAGLDDDDADKLDIDAFRLALARRIAMFINDFPGCPEKACRRMHGCMAPNGNCENHRDDPPAPQDEWDEARFATRRALDAHFDALGGIDAVDLQLEQEDEARRAAQAALKQGDAHRPKGA